jgi:hypothetical protein
MSLRLDWCSHEAAKYAVEKWHYSQSLPAPPLVKVGVWEYDKFIGCVLFSRGANNNIGSSYNLLQTEIAELTRVALASHVAPVSRIGAIAIKMLRSLAPSLRLLVSYADPDQDHHGGIYQAMNWSYVGQMNDTTEYIDAQGRRWHARMVSPSGKKKVYGSYRPVLRPDQCTPVKKTGKHKYLYPLDAAMRSQIAPLAKPYPKPLRAASIDSDATGNQPDQGGATPTAALHTEP